MRTPRVCIAVFRRAAARLSQAVSRLVNDGSLKKRVLHKWPKTHSHPSRSKLPQWLALEAVHGRPEPRRQPPTYEHGLSVPLNLSPSQTTLSFSVFQTDITTRKPVKKERKIKQNRFATCSLHFIHVLTTETTMQNRVEHFIKLLLLTWYFTTITHTTCLYKIRFSRDIKVTEAWQCLNTNAFWIAE